MRHQCFPAHRLQVVKTCAAAIWGLSVTEEVRRMLLSLNVVEVLLNVAKASLTWPAMPDADFQEVFLADGKCSQTQRNQLQVSITCSSVHIHLQSAEYLTSSSTSSL